MKRIVAIIGSQRSGTTMMGQLLGHHSQNSGFIEADGSYKLIKQTLSGEIAHPTPYSSFQVPGYTHHILKNWQYWEGHNPILLFMVRNPYDVITSMLTHRNGDWGLRHVFGVRNDNDVKFLRKTDMGNLNIGCVLAARLWRGFIDMYLEYIKLGADIHPFFYDDLLESPEGGIHDLCNKIGLEVDPLLLQFKIRDERGKSDSLLSDENLAKINGVLGEYQDYRSVLLNAYSPSSNIRFL